MTHSKEELEQALIGADSFREVLTNLGKKINNGSYRSVKGMYRSAGVAIPEFQYTSRKANGFKRMSDSEFLRDGVHRSGVHLKERMLLNGVIHECCTCGLPPEWQGSKLTLQVDHIDGDSFNNVLENLRFLCPNCHAQTATFGRSKGGTGIKYNYCPCGVRITKQSKKCVPCTRKSRPDVLDWPPVSEVVSLVNETNFFQAGKKLGTSDNSIRKFLQKYGVDTKEKPLRLPEQLRVG